MTNINQNKETNKTENKKVQSNFYILPFELSSSKEINASDKIVLMVIYSGCGIKGYCWATNASIAYTSGMHKVSISKIIKKLTELQYITTDILLEENSKIVSERRIFIQNKTKEMFGCPPKPNATTPLANDLPPLSDTLISPKPNAKGNRLINNLLNRSSNISKKKQRNTKTEFDINESISKEDYQKILIDKDLADNDRDWLLRQVQTMADHFDKQKKTNWNATLRNWIRKARYQFGDVPNKEKIQKPRFKTKMELQQEDMDRTKEMLFNFGMED